MRRTFLPLGALVLALTVDASARAERTQPLFTTAGPVYAVRADGGAVAWMTAQRYDVRVRLPGARREAAIATRRPAPVDVPLFEFAGGRALWSWTRGRRATEILVGAVGGRPRVVDTIRGGLVLEDGELLTDMAGRGRTLAYCTLVVRGSFVVGGRVMRIAGRRAVEVPGAPPAMLVAAGGGRLALAPAERTIVARDLRPEARVEVRNAVSGRLLGSVSTPGKPLALALSTDVLAVLVGEERRTWVERYEIPSLRPLGVTPVQTSAWQLSVSGTTVLFATRRVIRALDAVSGRSRILAVARREPIGLSADGRRAIWAVADGARTRFVAVAL
jgi:hypothetical protein